MSTSGVATSGVAKASRAPETKCKRGGGGSGGGGGGPVMERSSIVEFTSRDTVKQLGVWGISHRLYRYSPQLKISNNLWKTGLKISFGSVSDEMSGGLTCG